MDALETKSLSLFLRSSQIESFRFAGSSPRSLGTAGEQILTFQLGLSGVLAKAAPMHGPDSVPGQANPVS